MSQTAVHVTPATAAELAATLRDAAAAGTSIAVEGAGTKSAMAGPLSDASLVVRTSGLNRILQYEPADLTLSVEAGIRYADLERVLAERGQMLPLDPPFSSDATIGGILASNSSGPRRRLYGTSRDLVIGMRFATLAGEVIQSGGMVVKNVAGLDMGKLLIGSFGTLAVIAVANFKVIPKPPVERTFALEFDSAAAAIQARDRILRGVLQPAAIDLLNPAAAASVGASGWILMIQAGGNAAVVERYGRELAALGICRKSDGLEARVRELTSAWLAGGGNRALARISSTLNGVLEAIQLSAGPSWSRAGNGVTYAALESADECTQLLRSAAARGLKGIIEFAPAAARKTVELWPSPGPDLEIMKRIKRMFDPGNLLNRGRLFRQL